MKWATSVRHLLWLVPGLLLGTAGLGLCGNTNATESVGFVVDLSGDWLASGSNERVRIGQALGAGATLAARSPQKGWRLVIALADGSSLSRACDPVAACSEPVSLPAAVGQKSSLWDRAVRAAGALLGHQPERYASTMSRGLVATDGVAGLFGDVLELRDVVGGLSAGRYSLELHSIEGPPGAAATRLAYANPGDTRIPAAAIRPGLYEAAVTSAANPDEVSTIWLLVVEGARLPANIESFAAARTLTESWGEGARPRAVRSYLRAYLEVLAQQSSDAEAARSGSR